MNTITKNELIQKINSFYVYEKTNSPKTKILRPKENLLLLKNNIEKRDIDKTWFTDLKNILPDNLIINQTNLSDNYCFEYKISTQKKSRFFENNLEFVKTLGEIEVSLKLFISLLGNYYFFTFEELKYINGNGRLSFKTSLSNDKHNELLNKIRSFMEHREYMYTPKKIINIKLKDIETKNIACNNVTIFNCLFSEFRTIS